MRLFENTDYGIVCQSIVAACAGRKPSECETEVSASLGQLQGQGIVTSWSISIIAAQYGLVIQAAIPSVGATASIYALPVR